VGGTYGNEINYLKGWISDRMAWMDSKLDRYMFPYSTDMRAGLEAMDLQIFPNPVVHEFNMALNVDWGSELQVEVVNVLAQTTYRADFDLAYGPQTLYFGPDVVAQAMPQSGIYILNLHVDGIFVGARKILKQ
jgi:hypothetical protein